MKRPGKQLFSSIASWVTTFNNMSLGTLSIWKWILEASIREQVYVNARYVCACVGGVNDRERERKLERRSKFCRLSNSGLLCPGIYPCELSISLNFPFLYFVHTHTYFCIMFIHRHIHTVAYTQAYIRVSARVRTYVDIFTSFTSFVYEKRFVYESNIRSSI